MELLILLVERRGGLVSREEISERLWGKDAFHDVDHGINTAIRKVRVALRDDPESPRFVETVVGRGYRFAAPVNCSKGDSNRPVQLLESPVHAEPANRGSVGIFQQHKRTRTIPPRPIPLNCRRVRRYRSP